MTAYYIDYASGADTNAGTSTSAPWKHCPGDPSATGNAAACVLVAGDVVNFKGGVYRGQIVCNRSGASGSPITYKTGATGITSDGATIDQTKIANLDATVSSRSSSAEITDLNGVLGFIQSNTEQTYQVAGALGNRLGVPSGGIESGSLAEDIAAVKSVADSSAASISSVISGDAFTEGSFANMPTVSGMDVYTYTVTVNGSPVADVWVSCFTDSMCSPVYKVGELKTDSEGKTYWPNLAAGTYYFIPEKNGVTFTGVPDRETVS